MTAGDLGAPTSPSSRRPFEAYGFFFGVSREDFERANGFDMRFVNWGGEDEDLAARLRRLGLRCGWPGPDATLLHLWHEPGKGSMRSNAPLVDGDEGARPTSRRSRGSASWQPSSAVR